MSIWSVLSYVASVLSIVSAVVTVISAFAIRDYYGKLVNHYSIEKITIAEQKSFEIKKEYQKIKKMYANSRGIRQETFSESYINVENMLDDVQYILPVGYDEISALIKYGKECINQATEPELLQERNNAFLDLGRCLDRIIDKLKIEKATLQKQNIKNTKNGG